MVSFFFFFGLSSVGSICLLLLQGDLPTVIYKNYVDQSINSSVKPENTHLWIELDSGVWYAVDDTSNTRMYYSANEGSDWTQLDMDPGNTWGGATNKERPHNIVSLWHDRVNSTIWGVDCAQSGAGDNFKVWKLDYSGSESAPTITEIGTSTSADANSVNVWDIFKISSNVYVINAQTEAGVNKAVVRDVDTFPFTTKDTLNIGATEAGYFGIVAGNDYYTYNVAGARIYCAKYDDTGPTLSRSSAYTSGYTFNQNYYNQHGNSYDAVNALVYGVAVQGVGAQRDLLTYNISNDTFTTLASFDICMMLDRNTASATVYEKAFHRTEYKVYQIHSQLPRQWHLISNVGCSTALKYITDNYLMLDNGDVWQWENVSSALVACELNYDDMNLPSCNFALSDDYPLTVNMLITIEDMMSTSTTAASQVIYEGKVENYNNNSNAQYPILTHPAEEMDNIFPEGSYSGRTDQIISSLIQDNNNYITSGTLTSGTAMGTIVFYGDKTEREVLNDFALIDNKIWYLTPSGQLNYNSGAVDSGVDLSNSKLITGVTTEKGPGTINWAKIWGAISAGSQYVGTVSTNSVDILQTGKKPYRRTISFLGSTSACTVAASNIRARFGTQANFVMFGHQDSSVGVMQVGETLTFEFSNDKLSVSSAQYGIRTIKYDARRGMGYYTVSDRIS